MRKLIAKILLTTMSFNAVASPLVIPDGSVPQKKGEYRVAENKPDSDGNTDPKAFGLGKASSAANTWLQNFLKGGGTAKVDLSGTEGFKTGSVDILRPLYEDEQSLMFTQFGLRRSNQLTGSSYRTTINAGVGYRYFWDEKWMTGINAFYDRDLTVGHQRLGVGSELWTDYLKLSANAYLRLSEYRDSPDVKEYQERPANGWDVRAEGYLPQYPELGGKVKFEQYYGEEVGLFGAQQRQKDPSALTLGLSYTPIPLMTVSLDHRFGQGGQRDTSFKVELKYTIGESVDYQSHSRNVAAMRRLKFSKYDLVERNNTIVLQYRKKDIGQFVLPDSVAGNAAAVMAFPIGLKSLASIQSVAWEGTAAEFTTIAPSNANGEIQLPPYQPGALNVYELEGIATDAVGRKIRSNRMLVIVNPLALSLARLRATALSDGVDELQFTAKLVDKDNQPIADRPVTWTVDNSLAVIKSKSEKTDSTGTALLTAVSAKAAKVLVTVKEALNGFSATADARFVGNSATAAVAEVITGAASVGASGTTATEITAVVKDSAGNAVGDGVAVAWSTTMGSLQSAVTKTDETGLAKNVLQSPGSMGTATLVAKANSGDGGKSATVQFAGDPSTAKVSNLASSTATLPADGTSTVTLVATLKDAANNAVGAGVPVKWVSNLGSVPATSLTDASGNSTVTLVAPTIPGVATIKATGVVGDVGKTSAVTFAADTSTADVTSLSATSTTLVANGTSTTQLRAEVRDARGNSIGAGKTVNWTTSLGVINATSVTDAAGIAVATLTSATSTGSANVTAKFGSAAGKALSLLLIADNATATVATLSASQSTIVANGSSSSTLTASVKDGHGNPVGAGVTVSWATTLGTIASTSTTDATGTAVGLLKSSTNAGTAVVAAKASSGDAGKTAVVNIAPDSGTAKVSSVSASPASANANGTDVITLTAILKDGNGNRMGAGIAVNWSSTKGTIAQTSQTDATGAATASLTSTLAGSGVVTAKGGSGDAGQTVSVTFNPDVTTARVGVVNATPNSVIANGSTISLTTVVSDAYGNPVGAGQSVSWISSGGTLASSTTNTDASGKATVVLTSGMTAGTYTVTAKAAAGDPGKSTTVAFTGNPATAQVANLTSSQNSAAANGQANVTVTATVKDAGGNSVGSGIAVNWTTTAGSVVATSLTDTNGQASATITAPTTVGTATITAKAASGDAGRSVTVSYVADSNSAKVNSFSASRSNAPANGSDTIQLTATVVDGNGNPLGAGNLVKWTATAGTVVASSTTDASGTALATLTTPTAAGTATLKAVAGSSDTGKTLSITYIADATTAHVISLSSSASTLVANGSQATLTATVADANGNLFGNGIPVSWSTTGGSLSASNSNTDASGKAIVVLTSSTTVGVYSVSAKATGADAGKTVSVTFTGDAATARVVGLTSSQSTAPANGSANITLTATVKDANGNAAGAGITVNWSGTAGSVAATSVTNASGVATAEVTAPTSAGAATFIAKGAAGDPGQSVSVSYTADSTTAKVATFTADKASVPANGTSTVQLTASLVDAQNNSIGAGVVVHWTTTSGAVAATSTTDASGTAVAILTASTAAGTATVAAKGAAGDNGKTVSVAFVPDVTTARVTSIGSVPGSLVANGTAQASVFATVADANGNVIGAGTPVSWSSTGGSLAAATTNTDASGKALVTLTAGTVAGNYSVTAKAASGDAGKNMAISFTGDTTTARVVTLSSSQSTAAANSTGNVTLTAAVQDASGNQVGAGVVVNWTATVGSVVASSSTNSAGIATAVVTSPTTSGSATFTAKAVSGSVQTANVIYVGDASTARVTLISSDASSIKADGTAKATISAVLKDANGNDLGANLPVNWATTQGNLSAASTLTDSSGTATVTLNSTAAGSTTVTAKGTGTDAGKTVTLDVTADPASARVVSVSSAANSLVANGSSTTAVTAVIKDANGNTLGAGVSVAWIASGGTVSSATSVTDSSGIASVTFTAGTSAGNATVTAKAANPDAGKSAAIALIGDQASAKVTVVNATPTSLPANGTATANVIATLRDAGGNPVGAGVTVTWTANGGSLSSSSSITDTNSQASVVLTAPKVAGTVVVTATGVAGDSGKSTAIAVSGDPTTAKVVSVSASGTNIVANGSDQVTLTAMVRDASDIPVGAGVTVQWSTNKGNLAATSSVTDSSGMATMTLTSKKDGTATVTAKGVAGDIGKTAAVKFTADPTTAIVGTLNLYKYHPPGNGTVVQAGAQIVDANGNYVVGYTVNWSITSGTMGSASSVTDSAGWAWNTVTTSTVDSDTNVTMRTDLPNGSSNWMNTVFTGPSIKTISASPDTIAADNTSVSTVTATAVYSDGSAYNGAIQFDADFGSFDDGTTSTTRTGSPATVSWKSSIDGTSNVTASVNGTSQSVPITANP